MTTAPGGQQASEGAMNVAREIKNDAPLFEERVTDKRMKDWVNDVALAIDAHTAAALAAVVKERDEARAREKVLRAEVEASRELLSPRGASRLIDTAANLPWMNDYAKARAATDALPASTRGEGA